MKTTSVIPAAALALLAACGSSEPTKPPNPSLSPCPNGAAANRLSLAVGQVQVVAVPTALDCIALSGPGGGGTFLIVVGNASTAPDQKFDVSVPDSNGAAAARLVADRVSQGATLPLLAASPSALAEGRWRAHEARSLRLDDPAWRRAARTSMLSLSRVPVLSGSAVPAVGALLTFNVPSPTSDSACTHFTTQKGIVKAVGTHGILVQDTTAPAGGFTAADFASMSAEFDSDIYPADTIHFGQPSDIDNNGHVILFFTPQVNAGTPRGAAGVLEGFFFGGDLFPPSLCAESNQAEIFYLLVPDPTGKFSDPRPDSTVRQDIRGTIGHEFQHMINLAVRIRNDAPDEATWLNEGLSHFAEELVGRRENGWTDMKQIVISDLASNLPNYYAFFGQNLARNREFLLDPSHLGAISQYADTNLAVRGAAWSLLRWSADQYAGGTSIAPFTRALVAGPDTSTVNLATVAGVPFDTLMAGWLVATFAGGDGIAGLAPRYTFLSWDMRNVQEGLVVNNGKYPLKVTSLSPSTAPADTISSAAGAYFTVSAPTGGSAVIGALTSAGAALTFPGARLYILRTQ